MRGRRVYPDIEGKLKLTKGDYGQGADGSWLCQTPNGHQGDLNAHEVVEHADGTITVSPSILVTAFYNGEEKELWHGYLRAGVWEAC